MIRRIPCKERAKFQIGITLCFFTCVFVYKKIFDDEFSDSLLRGGDSRTRRILANQTECGTFSLEDLLDVAGETKPLCEGYKAFLLLAMFLMVYMFWALAIAVDEKFIPALEFFEDYWDISPDVAGATLMAAGGSAPEFFTNLFSSLTLTATGFGTIVGSAIFNILFVIAAVAYFSKEVLSLEWWIVFRDSTYYTLTIVTLFYFYLCGNLSDSYSCDSDGVMLTYESAILLAEYIIYCLILFTCHESIRDWVEIHIPRLVPDAQKNPELHGGNKLETLQRDTSRRSSVGSIRDLRKLEEEGTAIPLRPVSPCPTKDMEEISIFRQVIRFFLWCFSIPLLAFVYFIPGVESEYWKKKIKNRNILIFLAIFEFLLSLIVIGVLTYIMVFSAETFGKTIGIPDVVMGYTFLAAGTSAPDLLSSVFVALKGEGGMAVSSSIGSNIFDITVGLPVPWLISTAIGNTVIIQARSIFLSLATLLLMLVAVIITIIHQGWKLTNRLAVVMMILYFVFLLIVLIPEFVVT